MKIWLEEDIFIKKGFAAHESWAWNPVNLAITIIKKKHTSKLLRSLVHGLSNTKK